MEPHGVILAELRAVGDAGGQLHGLLTLASISPGFIEDTCRA